MSRRLLPSGTAVIVVFGLLSGCSGGKPRKIEVQTVGTSDVHETIEAPGTITARATATLRSPAVGTVQRLYVADGDHVAKGDVLARIDSPTAREQLAQARDADRTASAGGGVPAGVNLSSFRAQADRTARRGFGSARKAAATIPDKKQRAAVLAEIAKAEGEYAAAAGAAQAAVARLNAGLGGVGAAMSSITAAQRVQTRAAVRTAERTVKALTIKAPFSGVVSLGGPAAGTGSLSGLLSGLSSGGQSQAAAGAASLGGLTGGSGGGTGATDAADVAEGAPIAGGEAIVTVTDVSKLGLTADVDETDILRVHRGVTADVELDAVPGAAYTAEVTGIGVTPKESTGGGVSYKVTLSLARGTSADGTVAPRPKPGMSAVVDLRVRDVRATVAVPTSAVVTSGKESAVWVDSGGRAVRRVVRTGAEGDAVVQILSGLRAGERIVVRGIDTVRAGEDLPG